MLHADVRMTINDVALRSYDLSRESRAVRANSGRGAFANFPLFDYRDRLQGDNPLAFL